MPSSLTMVTSSALGYSPHPPVSVYGTVTRSARLEAFLGGMESASLRDKSLLTSLEVNDAPDLPEASFYRRKPGRPTPGWLILPRPSIAQTPHTWCRNINLFTIAYAFRPQLRLRLTLRGRSLRRNPWVYGVQDSHLYYCYSCQHKHYQGLHRSLRYGFAGNWYAPLPSYYLSSRSAASVRCLSPVTFSAQNHSTSELLRFL